MPLLTKPSSAPRTALFYITTGALLMVWSAMWWLMFTPESPLSKFICASLFFSGVVLLIIGFAVGQIGRAARNAELPPKEATAAEARVDQLAAARGVVPSTNAPPPVATPNQITTAAPGA